MLAVQTKTLALPARLSAALFAGVFGLGLLYFAAFANSATLHDAAHDTRHAIVAPCH